MTETMSIADAMALKNDGNGFGMGNDSLIWLVVLFLFFGNGFGQNGFGGAATAATQQEILLGQQFDRVEQKLDGIGKGICDSTYALNNSIKDCCCQTQLGMKDVMAGVHAEGEATRALLQENKIESLRDKVGALELKEAMCGVVRYPMQMSYATYCNPFCGSPCGGYQPNI